MEDNDEAFLIEKVSAISRQLLATASFEGEEIYWKTLYEDDDGSLKYKAVVDIYSGNAGIALFWLELYHVTGSKSHRDTSLKVLKWVLREYSESEEMTFSFYSGKIGVLYVLCRFFEITEDPQYYDKAYAIALELQSDLIHDKNSFVISDIIGGAAGALLGVTHLYSYQQDFNVVKIISELLNVLLTSAHVDKNGIYWDHEANQIKGLCGISHGVSGVAFALMEVAHIFDCNGLGLAIRSALSYEDYLYDEDLTNWPDLRIGIYSDEQLDQYISSYFFEGGEMLKVGFNTKVWCHGSPGCGMVRLRYQELYGRKKYEKILRDIKDNLLDQLEYAESFTCCHGLAGNADYLLNYFQSYNDQKGLATLKENIIELLRRPTSDAFLQKSGFSGSDMKDYSLMNGLAGVGHFLLRCIAPEKVTSILIPRVRNCESSVSHKEFIKERFDEQNVKMTLLKTFFPEGTKLGEKYDFKQPLLSSYLLPSTSFKLKQNFNPHIVDVINELELSQEEKDFIVFYLRLEHKKVILDLTTESYIFETVRLLANRKIDGKLGTDKELKDVSIILDEGTYLVKSKFDIQSKNMSDEADIFYALFNNGIGTSMIRVNKLIHIICRKAKTRVAINKIVAEIEAQLDFGEESISQVESIVTEQIRQLLKIGILNFSLDHSTCKRLLQ